MTQLNINFFSRFRTLAFLLAVFSFSPLPANEPAPGEKDLPYQRISVGDYQNFIGNWDDKKDPVLCALIRSPGEYNAVFHPAAVMGNKKPYEPEKSLYEKEQIIVVARVMRAPGDMEKSFEVSSVAVNGDTLMVSYRVNDDKSDATYTVKNFLALRIPRKDYKRVLFLEGGKHVGELKPSEGAWCNINLMAR